MSTTTTSTSFPTAKLGRNGPSIPRLGFGLMGLSSFYGATESDELRFKVLDRAIELGETFWDSQCCLSSLSLDSSSATLLTIPAVPLFYPRNHRTDPSVASDMYGDNEDLLGAYFTSRPEARDKVFLASKFAIRMDENGGMVGVDSSPEYIEKAIEKSLKRMKTDRVDLYYWYVGCVSSEGSAG